MNNKKWSYFTLAPLLLSAATSNAAICNNTTTVEVCLAIDGSGSINKEDFKFQIKGLADSVIDPTVICADGTVTLSVVQFSSSARVELKPTLFTDQNIAQSAQATIQAISKMGGGTNIGDGINLCLKQMTFNSSKQIIGIATDGQSSSGVSEAKAAIAKRVDSINTLGVGNGVDKSQLSDIAHPKPVSNSALDDGFFITTPDYSSFYQAVREMIAGSNGYITPPEIPSAIRTIHSGEKVNIQLPPRKSTESDYVTVNIPNGDAFSMESINKFTPITTGKSSIKWSGGNTIIDIPITPSLADGKYSIHLKRDPSGEEKTVHLRKKPIDKSTAGYMNYEFGCIGQPPIASEKMPITINQNHQLFKGKIYFSDYDGIRGFAAISARYDIDTGITANTQMHYRDNDFADFNFYRTDSFIGAFDSTGQLVAHPEVIFQPGESGGCPIYINLSIQQQKARTKHSTPTLMDILVK